MTTNLLAPHEIPQIDPKTLKSTGSNFTIELFNQAGTQIGWVGLSESSGNSYAVIVQQESNALIFTIYTDSDGNNYLVSEGSYLTWSNSAKWAYFSAWGGATPWSFEADGSLLNTNLKQHLSYYDSDHPQLYVWDKYNWVYVKRV